MRRRIALNGLFLDYPYSGISTYTRNLVRGLAELDTDILFDVIIRRGSADAESPGSDNLRYVKPPWPFPGNGTASHWIERVDKFGWEQVALPMAARRADLLHSLYFAAPRAPGVRLVVTVHDTIPLSSEYGGGRHARIYSELMRRAVRRASAIIAVSEFAKAEISSRLDYPPGRIHVIPEAPDPGLRRIHNPDVLSRATRRYLLPERYVLYLGGAERRKNALTLLRAWSRLAPTGIGLVLVGRVSGPHPLCDDVSAVIRSLPNASSVLLIDSVMPEDLAAVYTLADVFCYPSLQEGFGLPPLEAMACGTPVIASNATSLPEVLREGALLLPPLDVDAWADALEQAISDADWRAQASEMGRRVVTTYSWTETACRTLALYNAVLAD